MLRDVQFSQDEWYHCFSRGVDKRVIFEDPNDHKRFQMLLFACNSTIPIRISDLKSHDAPVEERLMQIPRGEQFVDIGAYALMPNHYHLLLRQNVENGITSFMQKLGTGYTMYFNIKNQRSGPLFSSRFKAKHIHTDQYFRRVINYIHTNPAELYERDWKRGVIRNVQKLRAALATYPYSSFPDYLNTARPESLIVSKSAVLQASDFVPDFISLLEDARTYAQSSQF